MKRAIFILAAASLVSPASAQVSLYVEPTKQLEPPPPAQAESKKPWSLEINVDATSNYVYRGYLVANEGLILQPSVEFDYTVYDRDGFTVTPYIGTWHNITSERLGPGSPRWWSEADVYPGVKLGYADFELDLYYNFITYPSRSSGQQQELDVALSYDDSAAWESSPWFAGFQPHVGLYLETQDRNDGDCNKYLEFGLEPTFKPLDVAGTPVTFSVPTLLGTSVDAYYTDADGHNTTFGYASAGLKASVPLKLIPGADCTLNAEVTWVHLFAESAQSANNDADNAFVARVGTKIEF